MPRCSSKIFVPKAIKITPPVTCALSFKARPKNFPTWNPKKEVPKVVSPISRTTREIFIFKKANETPTPTKNTHIKFIFTHQSFTRHKKIDAL